ncbi:cupin domain-containing protein [Cohaesibacter intestini]|uniref:cupin domain-containing protein n=1 Tax=Cohaesibacter intestini TaxID=2211145 RepID=UPI000DEBB5FD|nr:cupin domain-containing protein [Cohaesibacter intestini]
MTNAKDIIAALEMQPHPEGGYFSETFRDGDGPEGRGHSTAIYYLLEAGDRSHWHRVDATEIWFWHGGAPLLLRQSADGKGSESRTLGPNILAGERPQIIVPRHHWQSAESLGDWTLVSCTVAPGFVFDGFEMASPDWQPGQ